MLETNKANSRSTPKLSLITWILVGQGFVGCSLNFKHIDIIDCNALKKNLCPLHTNIHM
jgi:hypothetical protein